MRVVSSRHKEGASRRGKRWRLANPKKAILHSIKSRCMARGIEFNITAEDVPDFPSHCPVLGIPLLFIQRDKGGWYDDSPSIDRIDPTKGYIKGNIRVISNRANRLRCNATLEELEKVVEDARSLRH